MFDIVCSIAVDWRILLYRSRPWLIELGPMSWQPLSPASNARTPVVMLKLLRRMMAPHEATLASDGVDTLAAMAEASRQNGYSYIGIAAMRDW
jgi:hypothetical protein